MHSRHSTVSLSFLLLATGMAALVETPLSAAFVRGDANADGLRNISDPVFTLGFLFLGGLEPPCADAADADDSGLLNITDAIYSLKFLFLGGPAPPSPHLGCGSDPTADALGCSAFLPCGSGGCRPAAPALDPYPATTRAERITLTGSVQPGAAVEVSGPNFEIRVEAPGGRFSVEVPLAPRGLNRLNRLSLQADTSCGELSSPTTALVTHDAEPPSVVIDHPANGSEITAAATDVAGRVADLHSGFLGLEVSVNGEEAIVEPGIGTNGTFFLAGLPLLPGENIITAVATDTLGNTARREATVRRIEPPTGVRRLEPVSGNGQSASVFRWLPDPIVVRLVHADGRPFAGKLVAFHVARSDGRLSTGPEGQGELRLGVHTDAGGLARAFWRLGGDAGRGNNRVEVTSRDIVGKALFCASASAGVPSQINISSGNHQRVEVGGEAPLPLRARVSDGCNGVAGVAVIFTVLRGGGKVNGEDHAVVRTANTGHAEVAFRLGNEEGNQLIRASFGRDAQEATFSIFGLRRDAEVSTSFSGLVLDNASQPIEGATCILEVPSFEGQVARTDRNGAFHFEVPRAGPSFLTVNGLTATHVGGEPGRDVPAGSFPSLPYDFLTIPNAANSLPAPVLLPYLNPSNARSYDGTRDVELTVEGIDGLKMRVKAGSMRRRDGSIPSPADPAVLALNTVHHDDVPMPMPDGAAPPFAWTLQPAGAIFDPPVEVVYPNMSGLPAGAASYFLSFNHDTSRFEIVASGRVDDDGASIRTMPGEGLRTAGWGCNCPPYSVTANCRGCPSDGGGAGGDTCEPCEVLELVRSPPDLVCPGERVTIRALVSPAGERVQFSGDLGANPMITDDTLTTTYASAGERTVTATCEDSSQSITLSVFEAVEVLPEMHPGRTSYCVGERVNFKARISPARSGGPIRIEMIEILSGSPEFGTTQTTNPQGIAVVPIPMTRSGSFLIQARCDSQTTPVFFGPIEVNKLIEAQLKGRRESSALFSSGPRLVFCLDEAINGRVQLDLPSGQDAAKWELRKMGFVDTVKVRGVGNSFVEQLPDEIGDWKVVFYCDINENDQLEDADEPHVETEFEVREPVVHRLTIAKHVDVTDGDFNDVDAGFALEIASTLLREKDRPDDVRCCVQLELDGSVGLFGQPMSPMGTPPDIIQTQADLDAVFSVPAHFKVVNLINFCGGPGSALGCTREGTLSMIIFKHADSATWAHEFGHARGIPGDYTDPALSHRIMHLTGTNNSNTVSEEECDEFR